MGLVTQPSFSKGELTPALYGRVDTAVYRVGLKTAKNAIVHPHGGVSNRPGTVFIGPVKEHAYAPRLIEFQFKTTDQYILEFGHQYMRVIRDDGHVLETAVNVTGATAANPVVVTANSHGFSNGDEVYITGVVGMTQINGNRYIVANATTNTFSLKNQVTAADINGLAFTAYSSGGTAARVYTLTTPYNSADLAELKYVQSADVMTLTHKNYAPRELSRTGHTSWALSIPLMKPSITHPTNITVTTGEVGAATVSYKVTAIAAETGEESLAGTNATSYAITGATQSNPCVLTITSHGFSNGDEIDVTNVSGMTELNDRRFIVANKTTNTVELLGEDSSGYAAYASGGDAAQTFVKITAVAITGITQANPAVVTAAGHGFANGETVNISGVLGMTEVNNRSFTVAGRAANTFQLSGENSTSFTAYSSGGNVWKSPSDNLISWDPVDGAAAYSIYKSVNGFFALIGQANGTSFTDLNLALDYTVSPPTSRNPFIGEDNYPATVSFFEQRRVFGNTNNKPDTSWYSKIGSYSNYSVSFPGQDDDAITAALSSRQVNEIRHYVPGNDLLVFTSGSEWKVNSGPDAAFTASSIKQKVQSGWGCSHLRPITAGNVVVFVEENNASVRSLGYQIQQDGYTGASLSRLASHLLLENELVSWAYCHSPEPRIHLVRDDGVALAMTFDQEQEVVGWTHWHTKGNFEEVAALRHTTSHVEDGIYFVVQRVVGGQPVRYIERVASRSFSDVRDCFFVDCGLSYDSPMEITGATAANPVVITAVGHGFSNGDEVDIEDIEWVPDFDEDDTETQPDQLNGGRFTVANATSNTFELQGEDGSAFNAYVEGGVVRKAILTITGLNHLEGETVAMLADGDVVADETVAGGSITLARKASRVHVGLKYVCDVATLDLDSTQTAIAGKLKNISEVTIKFKDSRGLLIGPDEEHLDEMKQREFEDLGEPTALLTGARVVPMNMTWGLSGSVFMRQRDPLPMTILSVSPDVVLGD